MRLGQGPPVHRQADEETPRTPPPCCLVLYEMDGHLMCSHLLGKSVFKCVTLVTSRSLDASLPPLLQKTVCKWSLSLEWNLVGICYTKRSE